MGVEGVCDSSLHIQKNTCYSEFMNIAVRVKSAERCPSACQHAGESGKHVNCCRCRYRAMSSQTPTTFTRCNYFNPLTDNVVGMPEARLAQNSGGPTETHATRWSSCYEQAAAAAGTLMLCARVREHVGRAASLARVCVFLPGTTPVPSKLSATRSQTMYSTRKWVIVEGLSVCMDVGTVSDLEANL